MPRKVIDKGLVQIYTGNGKGKTTASLGLAVRAIGHGCKIFMIQFMKGSKDNGELHTAEKYLPNLTIVQTGLETFVSKINPSQADIEQARRGLETAKKVIMEGQYDMVILDEINIALDYNLIELDDVIKIIKNKPEHLELVLTGRNVPPRLAEYAHLISEVSLVKHPYDNGVPARKAIEY